MTFASVGLAPGYPGAGMNPARCFAFAVARGEFRRESESFLCIDTSKLCTRFVFG